MCLTTCNIVFILFERKKKTGLIFRFCWSTALSQVFWQFAPWPLRVWRFNCVSCGAPARLVWITTPLLPLKKAQTIPGAGHHLPGHTVWDSFLVCQPTFHTHCCIPERFILAAQEVLWMLSPHKTLNGLVFFPFGQRFFLFSMFLFGYWVGLGK